jgi:primosomal protein N'
VTGSGKTAVYVRLIERSSRRQDRHPARPEIARAADAGDVLSYIGEQIAVLHSSLLVGVRTTVEARPLRRGPPRHRTRSAVFPPGGAARAPLIDEEQDPPTNPEQAPRYREGHRALPLRRIRRAAAARSATPDWKSRYLAETGRYAYFSLQERYNRSGAPGGGIAI